MASLQWLLDLLLAGLLAVTLFHAMRLERALGVLKRDRGALDALMESFNASTRDAEAGIEKLRALTEGAGRQVVRQAELGSALKDDLVFLIERGDRLADRMDALIRTARPIAAEPLRPLDPPERLAALRAPERAPERSAADTAAAERTAAPAPGDARMRSQAERDLLQALRMTK